MRTVNDFIEGDIVDVYANDTDPFYDFTGTIVALRNDSVEVVDDDDDTYTVDPDQCRLSK